MVTVRLWDEQVAAAYRESFDEFSRSTPTSRCGSTWWRIPSYFDTLRTDVAGGGADDIFWLSNAYFAGYADSGRLMDDRKDAGPRRCTAWEPSVVDQFTRDGVLWGVPQLTDAGIAVYFNADLLDAAGVRPRRAGACAGRPATATPCARCWPGSPSTQTDNRADTPGFDAGRIRQWGYNAANDLQGIYLNYIGSAGGVFQDGDRFAFDNPAAVAGVRVPGDG